MKRVFFLLVMMAVSLSANAQMSIDSGSPDLKIKFISCRAAGEDVFVDLTLANLSQKDLDLSILTNGYAAYDDEGNIYKGENNYGDYKVEQKKSNFNAYLFLKLPSEVFVKLRFKLEGVPAAASEITRMDFGYSGITAKLKHLPITRN